MLSVFACSIIRENPRMMNNLLFHAFDVVLYGLATTGLLQQQQILVVTSSSVCKR